MRTLAMIVALVFFATPARADLQGFLACLEAKDATVVSAHRGGPASGFPENALETLQRGYDAGVRHFEIDVVPAADGTLYLMHDRTLDRTSTGSGPVNALPWAEIAQLSLKDNEGQVTPYHPPLLARVLEWAVAGDAYLSLDFKGETSVIALTDAVAQAGAQDHVMYLAGTLGRALDIIERQRDAVVSLSLNQRQSLADIKGSAIPPSQIMLWTGFREFDEEQVGALDDAGFFVSFGTLGFGDSYDDRIAASGNEARYGLMAGEGLHMIATDRPLAARSALVAAGRAWDSGTACR